MVATLGSQRTDLGWSNRLSFQGRGIGCALILLCLRTILALVPQRFFARMPQFLRKTALVGHGAGATDVCRIHQTAFELQGTTGNF
jgi:hypothetical protein